MERFKNGEFEDNKMQALFIWDKNKTFRNINPEDKQSFMSVG